LKDLNPHPEFPVFFRPLLAVLPLVASVSAAEPVFEPTKVWPIHITLTAAEYAAMQSPVGGGFPQFGAPPAPPKETKPGEREVHRNVFGVDQPWARGTVTVDGKLFENVAIRYKGNGTLMETARSIKKSFKIDLDKHGGKETFHGLKTLNLHCGVTDPSKSRETLAYATFRNAGVPAPKTALAEVTLTVPGKFDQELLGLYTLVQPVDKSFLKENFKTDAGLLMKPERLLGLDHLGDDWERYKTTYQPKRDATAAEQKRVIAFTKLVNRADDATFRKEIGEYLDVDAFLRFLAVHSVIVHMDSFFITGHNYCLYLHPETYKFHFIPWDVDRAFANFGIFGTQAQQLDMSLEKPYQANRLADRLMAMPGMGERYRKLAKEVVAAAFSKEKVLADIESIRAATKGPMAREAKVMAARRESAAPTLFGPPPDLPTFVEKRSASIAAQLEGKSRGYVPQPGGFGFGGPPGGGGLGPENPLSRSVVEALDINKDGKLTEAEFTNGMMKFFVEWDKDKNGMLDQKEVADGLQKLMPQPGGFGPPPVRR
jgi:spore coat protein CotH